MVEAHVVMNVPFTERNIMRSNDTSYIPRTTASSNPAVRRPPLVMVVATILSLALVIPADLRAEGESQTGTSQLVTGASCFLLTPVYGAFKLAFAGTGAIVGGFTWLFTGGDEAAAQKVWDSSLKGTYVITPDHLSGQKQVQFVGSRGTSGTERQAARAQTSPARSTSK